MNKVKTSDLIGDLDGMPLMIVQRMLDYAVAQGNKFDVTVFQKDKWTSKDIGGFSWDLTPEGNDFWRGVMKGDYSLYFERYPYEPRMMEVSGCDNFRGAKLMCVIFSQEKFRTLDTVATTVEEALHKGVYTTLVSYARFPQPPKPPKELTLEQAVKLLEESLKEPIVIKVGK